MGYAGKGGLGKGTVVVDELVLGFLPGDERGYDIGGFVHGVFDCVVELGEVVGLLDQRV